MDSGWNARSVRVLDSIVRELDRGQEMRVVIIRVGVSGRLWTMENIQHLPAVGDSIIVNGQKFDVCGRTFDIDKNEIRIHVQ